MSLLPTIIWLNIAFSPHQVTHCPPPLPRRRRRFTGWRQYDGAVAGIREKSQSPSPSRALRDSWAMSHGVQGEIYNARGTPVKMDRGSADVTVRGLSTQEATARLKA